MTGFRVGYIAASIEIVNALSKLQSHLSGNVCTFVQYGALAAIVNENGVFERHRKELEEKRDVAYRRASNLFECIKPQGAFYVFPNISKWLKKGESSLDFAADLLQKTGVAVVPGEAFGVPGHRLQRFRSHASRRRRGIPAGSHLRSDISRSGICSRS